MSDNKNRIERLTQRLSHLQNNMENEKSNRSNTAISQINALKERFEDSVESQNNKYLAMQEVISQVAQQVEL